MATQPTRSIRWATDGGADIVEPTGGERDIGWTDGQKPPAEYFNYLMRGYYDWQQFFVTELLQRDGSVPVTGTLKPNTTNTRLIGASTSLQFENIFVRKVTSTNNIYASAFMSVNAGVFVTPKIFNVSLSFSAAGINVYFGSEFAAFTDGVDYGVFIEPPTDIDNRWSIEGKSSTGFRILLYDDVGATIDLEAVATLPVHFHVVGRP